MILAIVQIAAVVLVSVAMALSLAHALEFPGKMRLQETEYHAVRTIYYPGFTIGGAVGEFLGLLATAALLVLTPAGSVEFWLTLAAFVALLGVQAVYWLVTHPVNRIWAEGTEMDPLGSFFFGGGSAGSGAAPARPRWTELRDRWERSHVARAVLAFASFFALVLAQSPIT